jgi:glutamine synthetase
MATNHFVTPDALASDISAGVIDTVIVTFADHQGRLVGKRTDGGHYLDVVAREGTENCDYLLACDLDDTPIPGMRWASYAQGYGDMRAVVDTSTIRFLPWLDRTAIVLVDLVSGDDRPVRVSPRRMLQDQVERAAELGFVPMLGVELEFYVYRESPEQAHAQRYADLTPGSPDLQDYALTATSADEPLLGAIRRGLRAAGLPVEFSKGEAGRGQHELNLTYQGAVASADAAVLFKDAVKVIAGQHGRAATFMAKPFADETGSSGHVHCSLWEGGGSANAFADVLDEHERNDAFRWFLGGLITTARDFSLLVAPTVNSYKRYQPESWAPTLVAWDVDNRTVAFRVVGHGDATRVESRIPGADVNPYHAFAATIAGGLHGIAERIEPPRAFHGDGYTADAASLGLARLPTSLSEAIECWRTSAVARECFGDDVHEHVLRHAEHEWSTFSRAVTDWERRRYFQRT